MINPVDIYDKLSITGSPEKILDRKLNAKTSGFREQLEKSINSGKADFDEKRQGTVSKTIDKKLMDVCTEMESLLVAKMLKVMRDTVPKNKLLHGGFAEDVFEDMLYDEYSLKLSRTANLGIAKMLYDEMSRK